MRGGTHGQVYGPVFSIYTVVSLDYSVKSQCMIIHCYFYTQATQLMKISHREVSYITDGAIGVVRTCWLDHG